MFPLISRAASVALALIASALLSTSSPLPGATYVYVSLAGENRIAVFELDDRGGLAHRQDVELDGDPGALAVSPDGRFVFASFRLAGRIASFRLDRDNGRLKQVGVVKAAADPAFLACDRSGRYLLSAYYAAGRVAVHRIGDDGRLDGESVQWLPTADKAHAILTDPGNRFAFVPHTGPNRIFQLRFDPKDGKLTRNAPASVVTGKSTGPRHLFFHPRRPFVYFDNEQGSSVTAYRLDRKTGTLSAFQTLPTLPPDFSGRNSCARLAGTASGRFVYAANRGHDSIAGFAIDATSGRLTALGQFPTEKTPRGFAIDPLDRFLVAAGQGSDRLATYRIARDGRLDRLSTRAVGKSPWWVMIVDPSRLPLSLPKDAVGTVEEEPAPPGYKSMTAVKLAVLTGRLKLVDPKIEVPESVEVRKDVEYGKGGTRALKLDLYSPRKLGRAVPGLIFIHGGGWKKGQRGDYHYYCVKFAERGYVVATISYRLLPEGAFPAALHDVKCAVRWMRANAARLRVNPDRIGVVGGSAGGHLALLIGYSSDVPELEGDGGHPAVSSRVQAVVNLYGPTDLTTPVATGDQTVVDFFGGAKIEAARRRYELASPITHVTRDDPPTLIIHGTIDELVPVVQADRLAAKLRENGVPCRYDRLEGWPHTLDLAEVTNRRCRRLMSELFDRHLPLPRRAGASGSSGPGVRKTKDAASRR